MTACAFVRREADVGALRRMCRNALRDRDAARAEAAAGEARTEQLARDVDVLGEGGRSLLHAGALALYGPRELGHMTV